MKRAAALALAGMLLAACGKSRPKPQAEAPLKDLTERLTNRPPCSTTIPGEWSPSLPVPALQDGKLIYKVFFSGWEGNPKRGITYHTAEGDASFAPDGTILACARRAGAPKTFPARPKTGLSDEQWEQAQNDVYVQTEAIASLYAAGKADPAEAAKYSAAFAAVAQLPEEAADYRALSPEFWSWLEAHGGSGPKPAAAAAPPASKP